MTKGGQRKLLAHLAVVEAGKYAARLIKTTEYNCEKDANERLFGREKVIALTF